MAVDKSTVKIRLENQTGDKVSLGDVGSGLRLSCATTGKLNSLDSNGDGEISLQELMDSLDAQARQKSQLQFQRIIIIAGILLLLCSFGLSLGSSVLSFMMMSKMEVHNGALTDRQGKVLGSEPRNPTVHNVTVGEDAVRRLEEASDSSAENYKLPIDDFREALEKYRAGSTEFVVPINDAVITVEIEDATPLRAHGRTESVEWWADCAEDATHCSVMVQQLHARATNFLEGKDSEPVRRLFWGKSQMMDPCSGSHRWEIFGGCTYESHGQLVENPGCSTNWCFEACCYQSKMDLYYACPTCIAKHGDDTRFYGDAGHR